MVAVFVVAGAGRLFLWKASWNLDEGDSGCRCDEHDVASYNYWYVEVRQEKLGLLPLLGIGGPFSLPWSRSSCHGTIHYLFASCEKTKTMRFLT